MRRSLLVVPLLLAACADSPAPATGPTVRMDFTRRVGLFTAPVPSADLTPASAAAAWPNPQQSHYMQGLIALAGTANGFATSSTIYLPLTAAPYPSTLPGPVDSVSDAAPVFVMDLDHRVRAPVAVRWMDDGGPYGADRLLTLVPVQGIPLHANTRYAAVVRTSLRGPHGAFVPAPEMASLSGAYRDAVDVLAAAGVPTSTIAGLAVFRTGDPTSELRTFVDAARARPLPTPAQPFVRTDVFPGYCVYQANITVPSYQQGAPPFALTGGGWSLGADGRPAFARDEPSRVVVTVPRRLAPTAGFPWVLFVRTGGGGDRPLVDRGVQAVNGGPAITPGSGPAMEFAAVGFAGVQWDGPHGGPRNVSNGDEQFLMFNPSNPIALRDNVRQSALEAARMFDVATALTLDVSDCDGAAAADGTRSVRLDAATAALMGHSMGATITPLALAAEPRFRAAVVSGAGGSYIENVLYKLHPLVVRPLARVLVGYTGVGRDFTEDDPALALFQWATESSDPQVYGEAVSPQTHFFAMQGTVDHYILPPIAQAVDLAMGTDLIGPALDQSTDELRAFTSIVTLLPLRGGRHLDAPVDAPAGRGLRALGQFQGDTIEDGHETAFQTPEPKRLYRCFLASYAMGAPRIVGTGVTCGD